MPADNPLDLLSGYPNGLITFSGGADEFVFTDPNTLTSDLDSYFSSYSNPVVVTATTALTGAAAGFLDIVVPCESQFHVEFTNNLATYCAANAYILVNEAEIAARYTLVEGEAATNVDISYMV